MWGKPLDLLPPPKKCSVWSWLFIQDNCIKTPVLESCTNGGTQHPHTQCAGGGDTPLAPSRGVGGGPGWDEDVEHGGNVSYSRCWASRSHAGDAEGLQHRVPARGTRPIRARGTESPPVRLSSWGGGASPPFPSSPGRAEPPARAPLQRRVRAHPPATDTVSTGAVTEGFGCSASGASSP